MRSPPGRANGNDANDLRLRAGRSGHSHKAFARNRCQYRLTIHPSLSPGFDEWFAKACSRGTTHRASHVACAGLVSTNAGPRPVTRETERDRCANPPKNGPCNRNYAAQGPPCHSNATSLQCNVIAVHTTPLCTVIELNWSGSDPRGQFNHTSMECIRGSCAPKVNLIEPFWGVLVTSIASHGSHSARRVHEVRSRCTAFRAAGTTKSAITTFGRGYLALQDTMMASVATTNRLRLLLLCRDSLPDERAPESVLRVLQARMASRSNRRRPA